MPKKASLRSRLIESVLWRLRAKNNFAHTAGLHDRVLKSRPKNPRPPSSIYRRFRVTEATHAGRRVFTLTRKTSAAPRRMLYLHGGAYVYEIMGVQWKLLGKLLDRADIAITVPLYPLAPEHTAAEVLPFVSAIYDTMLGSAAATPIVFLGDSAGGGMALALSQQLRDAGRPQPERLILLSPWLDITCSDPAQDALERLDPILARPGLREQGRWYAGSLPPEHPSVSPLFGALENLPPTLLLIGTHDLLHADATRLQARLAHLPGALQVITYPDMLHVWPSMPVPEADQALSDVIAFLGTPAL